MKTNIIPFPQQRRIIAKQEREDQHERHLKIQAIVKRIRDRFGLTIDDEWTPQK